MTQNTTRTTEETSADHEADGGHVINSESEAADYLKAAIDSRW